MGQDTSIADLRARASMLVEQEAALLDQAFELSRAGGDRRGVDALFARIQAIQVERNGLKKQIGDLLGVQRLHAASEVWQPGTYNYCREVGGESVRVRVTRGPLGLQVQFPARDEAVSIESTRGTFDGPLADDGDLGGPAGSPAASNGSEGARTGKARGRPARNNRG